VLVDDTLEVTFRSPASVAFLVSKLSTDLASDGARAHWTFGALAPVNKTYLFVRTEAHCGRECRVLGGTAHQGAAKREHARLCNGFRMIVEEKPIGLSDLRERFVVNEMGVHVPRRLFERYDASGWFKRVLCFQNTYGRPIAELNKSGNAIVRSGGPRVFSATTEMDSLQ